MNLPPVTRSLRFRLSGWTSLVAFAVAAVSLLAIYLAFRLNIRSMTIRRLTLGSPVTVDGQAVVPVLADEDIRTIESILQEWLLNKAAVFVLLGLLIVFIISVIVGWVVSGRVLRPVNRLTEVAREIEATDLTRRLAMDGPDDEVTRMASTFDSMLDRLDDSFVAQRTFLAQTSHDLRNPLAIIRSNLDVTMSDPTASAEDWKATGEIIARASDRMSSMIDDLLAAARLEMGATRLVPVEVARLVDDVAEGMRARVRSAGHSFVVSRADDVTVDGDPNALERVLDNLIDNAISAAPSDSTIEVRAVHVDGWVALGVIDRGPGIDVSDDGSPSVDGGGLGLAIARSVAVAHRGRLRALRLAAGGSYVFLAMPSKGHGGAEPAWDLPAVYGTPSTEDEEHSHRSSLLG